MPKTLKCHGDNSDSIKSFQHQSSIDQTTNSVNKQPALPTEPQMEKVQTLNVVFKET